MYKGTPWPSDRVLLNLFVDLGFSRAAVAAHLGRSPESFRAYLRNHRPELSAQMSAQVPPGKPGAQRSREYRERHPERRREAAKSHYHANRAEILQKNAKWHRANRPRVRQRKALELQVDRERVNRVRRERNARQRQSVRRRVQLQYHQRTGGGATAVAYAAVLLADPCSYCGSVSQDVDHIAPLSRGGSPLWDNLTAACARCNRSKQDKSLLGFMLYRLGG